MPKQIIGEEIVVEGVKISLSEGVIAGNDVLLSGWIALTEDGEVKLDGDIREQTVLTMKTIERVLAKAGCTLEDVTRSLVVLKHREDFTGFNEAYGEFFPTEPPARTTIIAELVHPDVLVEIEMTARRPI
ncbi:RidA family protein [Pseudomaricurvus alkylphenolicus]|uniref:RidA family protein n=1 Tax=Pseudomaricurvus alkylphenolicus TaxID=1306991 RepID=UPI00141EA361|nr:RidA family protein [Pseudomaricurvus alkylphenolicus]NIB38040.1 RidA family protein [Pseudomaricurvus alkylphenolicus]